MHRDTDSLTVHLLMHLFGDWEPLGAAREWKLRTATIGGGSGENYNHM